MTFNSVEFLIFYPIVALLYFLLPKRAVWPMLLVASYYFYMCYKADLVFLIALTTVVSWGASHLIRRSKSVAVRRLFLAISLTVCFGVLFFYKYFNFISGSVCGLIELFGGTPGRFELELLLPVGISFYTFQTLSYVIDVYRGDVEPENNLFFYALFVSFFPQLVAGPIERPGNLIPQLKERHPWSNANAVRGAKFMIVGFFKKVCVADLISVYVDSVYNNASDASAIGIIIATVLFAVQIYCDFSGYSDIAIGCAMIMGIKLMKNFDHPYMAIGIKEFWDRWHISLSGWFKDYLYIPLGGSRCAKWRAMMNVFIVFLVSGLWHGANWTFVIWGAIHGFYRVFGSLTKNARDGLYRKIIKVTSPDGEAVDPLGLPAVKWWRRILTFALVAFAWIFFRANSIDECVVLLEKLFVSGWSVGFAETLSAMDLGLVGILTTLLSLGTLVIIDRALVYGDDRDRSDILTRDGSFVYFAWIVLLSWMLLLSKDVVSTFIYFQF